MAETRGKTIVFLGDSITEGVGASCIENCFVNLVMKDGKFAKGYNFGVGGTRIAPQRKEVNGSWSEDFIKRVERMPLETDFVLILAERTITGTVTPLWEK